MSIPDRSLPTADLTREEIARIEVGHTAVSPAVARALLACFLAAIAIVPIAEWIGGRTSGREDAGTAWSHLAGLPAGIGPYIIGAEAATAGAGLWGRIVLANRRTLAVLSEFERELDDESLIGRTLRRPAQTLMTGILGAGNEQVYPGREGWLFYRPDVEYVTGPGFLDPAQLRRRMAGAAEWDALPQPDPRPALEQFNRDLGPWLEQFSRDLGSRGLTLVGMPTPLKPGVHPEMLSRRYADAAAVLHNRSYGAWIEDLRRAGVLVFDPSDAIAAARRASPQYLMSDTHWRPETLEEVAELLGEFISAHVALPPAADPSYRIERMEARAVGDTARMLDLPDDSPLVPPETVWLRRVLLADGSLWRSARDADVLLLGDSFTNIYALESMGWGTSAGLAEQLSYTLRRPVDRIAQNDEAAFATRLALQQDADRLDGKRVVVYQFAARELAAGDWRILPLPGADGRTGPAPR